MSLLRSITIRAYLLLICSSLVQVFSFPTGGPMPAWREALAWVALLPMLMGLLLRSESGAKLSLAQAAVAGYVCGVLWYVGNCFWIYQTMYLYGGLPKPVSAAILVLFALYLGLYHALFAAIVAWVHRITSSSAAMLVVAPFAWVAVELARTLITGFPWDLLGNSQVDNFLLVRLAPVGGVMSLSFVVVAVNALFAAGLLAKDRRRILLVSGAAVCAGAMAACSIAGARRATLPARAAHYAVMLQENLSVGAEGREVRPMPVAEELKEFARLSVAATREQGERPSYDQRAQLPQGSSPSIVIWPEAPAHLRSDDPQFRASLGELARVLGAPAIIGSLGVDFSDMSARGYFEYDSASLFDADGSYKGRYDKIHLVPWGEYVPFKRFFSFASKLTEGVGDMDPGTERSVFLSGGHRYGIFICYESIFGDEVRQFAKQGAEVLVNISDDGWYGETGAPWQHLNMARMRAIENHRWLLRATNTGITTVIDPDGRMQFEAPRHVRQAFVLPFDYVSETTFYTRHGEWFAWICVAGTLLTAGFAKFLPKGGARA